ncbi:MAG: hypothetical protein WDM85_13765 [Caulobacteraceae bacterium]
MAVRGVDHINIGTHQLEETRAFFRDAIGLTEGWRPNFPFGGAWLYAGDTAVVHLVDLDSPKRPSNEAALDHFAPAHRRLRRGDLPAGRGRRALPRGRRPEHADPADQPARPQRREH